MDIIIINRKHAKIFKPEVPYIHFSVTDNERDFVSVPDNPYRKELIQLKFEDVERDYPEHNQWTITDEQAKGIIDIALKYKDDIQLIVCQCDGGISRSAGIAVGLSRLFNLNDSWIYNQFFPNGVVVNKMTRYIRKLADDGTLKF